MIFVRFRRLELRGAGGWLGSTANREHSNGILRSRFCARAKVTIFCTEVTVAQLGLMSDVPNECGADQKVGDLARPALAGHRGALRGHIPSGILPRNPALKAATLLSRGFDLGARTAGIFHSDDSNSHPPRPGGLVFDPFDATRIALPMALADGNGKRQQQPQSVGPEAIDGLKADVERVAAWTARLGEGFADFFLAELR